MSSTTERDGRTQAARLARVGVKILDRSRFKLSCNHCGQVWSPNLRPGGRLPRGYWKCPNGCNAR